MPRYRLSSLAVPGVSLLLIAATFSGRGAMPYLLMRCLRNSIERAYPEAEIGEAPEYCTQLEHVYFMVAAREQYVVDVGEHTDISFLSIR